jgi:hypothetical protein
VHDRVWSTDVFRDPAREVARVRGTVREEQRRREQAAGASRGSVSGRVPGAAPSDGGMSGAERSSAEVSGAAVSAAGVRWDSEGAAPRPGSAVRSAGSPWTAVAPSRRGERPRVPTGRPIEQYRESELDAVVTWICSDTLLRTHEQIAALVRQQLGVRRGSRVDAAVSAAIERVVARGEVRTADGDRAAEQPPTGGGPAHPGDGRAHAGDGVQAHDPHERWLLDQRPPHWD